MKKQNNQHRQYFLLATIATIFLLGASASTFAFENKTNHNFLTFDYLSSNAGQHLQLNSTPAKFDFTNIQSNPLAANINSAVEYPNPDFSGIEKWYEVVKWQYGDFEGGDNTLSFWIKPKMDTRPIFHVEYYDNDGVLVGNGGWYCACEGNCYANAPIGTVQKYHADAPTERDMKNVKTVKITRKEN